MSLTVEAWERANIRVVVTGGRDYTDRNVVFSGLDAIHGKLRIKSLVHGAATGVDSLAEEWAALNGVECVRCPADWDRYGKAAGPIRNAEILNLDPDIVIAFPVNRGTSNMVNQACKRGVFVVTVDKKARITWGRFVVVKDQCHE